MVELLTPAGTQAKVEIVYQTLVGLHASCPEHPGDWYFSGDYPTPGGTRLVNGWKKSSGILSNSTALCRARDSDSPFAGQSSKGWEERSVLSHGWVRGVLFGSRCLIRPTKRRFERDVA